jgi:hypothetical protein
VAGAPLEQIHSGRIQTILPNNAVVFTATSGRIIGDSYKGDSAPAENPSSVALSEWRVIRTE